MLRSAALAVLAAATVAGALLARGAAGPSQRGAEGSAAPRPGGGQETAAPQQTGEGSAAGEENDSVPRSGRSFIETPVHSLEDDGEVLELYEGLRVADVSDGLDAVGLRDSGLVSPEIAPLWRDTEAFTHRVVGIAVTARYVPARDPNAGRDEAESHQDWVGRWYSELSSEPFRELIREGSVLVIDEAEGADVGSIGSNNILSWRLAGCAGVVTDGTARDTDEIAAQGVPLYFRGPGRGIRPGRNRIESVNRPVVCGGVTVVPGDVVVADGDGVVVVPREHAREVARHARQVLEGDKAGRRSLYEKLDLPLDPSVK